MPKGKGWVLAGTYLSSEKANSRISEIAPKGYETAMNQSAKNFKGHPNTPVFKVWARDAVTKGRYKPDGRRRW